MLTDMCMPCFHPGLPTCTGRKIKKRQNHKIKGKGKEGCRKYDEEPKWHFVLLTCMTFQELYFAFFLLIVLPFCSPFTVCAIAFCLSEESGEQARHVLPSTLGSQVSRFQLADE